MMYMVDCDKTKTFGVMGNTILHGFDIKGKKKNF